MTHFFFRAETQYKELDGQLHLSTKLKGVNFRSSVLKMHRLCNIWRPACNTSLLDRYIQAYMGILQNNGPILTCTKHWDRIMFSAVQLQVFVTAALNCRRVHSLGMCCWYDEEKTSGSCNCYTEL